MGTGRLNIWVRDRVRPCNVDMTFQWSVDVFDCDGRPLRWCGTTYYGEHKTEHGHAEIEVPPGSYILRARTGSSGHHNLFTHRSMVVVGCDETVCVNLFVPGAWRCGHEFNQALQFQAEVGNIPREVALRAIEANEAVLELLPKDAFDPEPQIVEELLRMPREGEQEEGEKPKRKDK
jgi:hypothetical protein